MGFDFSSHLFGCKLCQIEDGLEEIQEVWLLVDPKLSIHFEEDSLSILGPGCS